LLLSLRWLSSIDQRLPAAVPLKLDTLGQMLQQALIQQRMEPLEQAAIVAQPYPVWNDRFAAARYMTALVRSASCFNRVTSCP